LGHDSLFGRCGGWKLDVVGIASYQAALQVETDIWKLQEQIAPVWFETVLIRSSSSIELGAKDVILRRHPAKVISELSHLSDHVST
jgi:hypothetical protein